MFCPFDFAVEKLCSIVERIDEDAHDRDMYGSTEIEMSNYPALLTHFEFSIHCADSGELSGTQSEFVNCNMPKICGKLQR